MPKLGKRLSHDRTEETNHKKIVEIFPSPTSRDCIPPLIEVLVPGNEEGLVVSIFSPRATPLTRRMLHQINFKQSLFEFKVFLFPKWLSHKNEEPVWTTIYPWQENTCIHPFLNGIISKRLENQVHCTFIFLFFVSLFP